ncbi:MAG: class I SAM-dependent methyltransferase [Gammaproteobacteria bacterium]|nr:class I SAM-dependent methyltransferase [Gammaproteobacteria bacterium]
MKFAKNKKNIKSRHEKAGSMSSMADRHALYEKAVQNVEQEYDFVDTTYRKIRGYKAHSLREDFCGTANMSCEWVRKRRKNTAVGIDIDPEVLDWGKQYKLGKLSSDARKRITLVKDDVLLVETSPVQVILAMNFSYQLFKTRELMRNYFKQVHKSLASDGIFFMDAFGGYDAYREIREKTRLKGFTYIWEQESYNPITGEMTCHIHFHFPDKSRMRKAFTYEWRLWTLPELQEILHEAGFSNITVHWEGTDEETGEGNGIYSPSTHGDADPGWVCFITAEK